MERTKRKPLERGDYVLATKWSNGSPCDRFHVGFFRGMEGDKYLVEDSSGQLVAGNSFRRCERISRRVGTALVRIIPIISDKVGHSVWWWRRRVGAMDLLYTENSAEAQK